MGLLVAQMRLMYLHQQKSDLEYKIQLVTQARMSLSQTVSELVEVGNDYDPDSPTTKLLQQRQAKLKVLESKLNHQMEEYQIRLKMVETEEQSAKAMLDKNIQGAFTYG